MISMAVTSSGDYEQSDLDGDPVTTVTMASSNQVSCMETAVTSASEPAVDTESLSVTVTNQPLSEDEEALSSSTNYFSDNASSSYNREQPPPNCCSFCLKSWPVWLRQLIMLIYVVLFIVASVFLLMGMHSYNINQFTHANFLAGAAMAFTVPMSLWGISQHLINYTNPSLQKYIIRVLWMVPIYSVLSFCGLHFTESNVIFDAIKDCYEAFVVYSFTCYLVRYLQQQQALDFSTKSAKHLIPFCCLSRWQGHDSIVNCTIGVLQYTLVKPIATVVTVITWILDVYHEGTWSFRYAWLYTMVLGNVSQIWALYCLVLFYKTFKTELKGSRPVAKFMCIKLVIFATWWQNLAISIVVQKILHLRNIKWIAQNTTNDVEVAHAIQDFLVCFEMFGAAIAHYYAFTHREFKDNTVDRVKFVTAVQNLFDVRDVGNDVVSHGYIVRQKVRDRIMGSARTRLNDSFDSSVQNGAAKQQQPPATHDANETDTNDKSMLVVAETPSHKDSRLTSDSGNRSAVTETTSHGSRSIDYGGVSSSDVRIELNVDVDTSDSYAYHSQNRYCNKTATAENQEGEGFCRPTLSSSPYIEELNSNAVEFKMSGNGDVLRT